MTRGVLAARPDYPLMPRVQGAAGPGGALGAVMPIVEGDRVVGMVTPQNMLQTMGHLGQTRRLLDRAATPKRQR